MIKFLDVLGRYDAAEFSQLEAAEFLGVESGRFGAGASVLRTTARWVCWIAGSARLVVGVGGNMVEFVHGDKPVVERLDPQFVDCEPEGRMGAGQHLVGTFEERADRIDLAAIVAARVRRTDSTSARQSNPPRSRIWSAVRHGNSIRSTFQAPR
jgi:hypothetical protein